MTSVDEVRTALGNLRDGDEIYDEAGGPCRVVTTHDVGYRRSCYEVTFSDGSVIVADAEHLWPVEARSTRVHGTAE
ncbi:MAG: hypothetical protein ACRDXB_18970 [Actinomycetes bacterium]